ncbi:MAG: CinA family nicotinamide mononucleotide deamidase-related protein, partial [Vibrio sp.]
MKIAMLSTGEEVLHGDIVDTNAAWLSAVLFEHGFGLSHRVTVGDGLAVITQALISLSHDYDVVIVNGGLGPTTDDLSAQAAANATGEPLCLQQDWVKRMQDYFAQSGREMPPSNLKQAMIPQSASVIDNPVGTACGFNHKINRANFLFTPGVPFEFKHMVQTQILPYLAQKMPANQGQSCYKFYTIGAGESTLAEILDPLDLPDGVQLGYRSYIPYIEVKVFAPKGLDTQPILNMIRQKIATFIVGEGQSLVKTLSDRVNTKSVTFQLLDKASGGELVYQLNQADGFETALIQGLTQRENFVANINDAFNQTQKFHQIASQNAQHGPDISFGAFLENEQKLIFTVVSEKESLAVQ